MLIHNRYEPSEETDEQEVLSVRADGGGDRRKRSLVKEHLLDIFVNEQLVFKLVCTPTDLPELIVGRMITEGLIRDIREIEELDICEYGTRAKVFLKEECPLREKIQAEPTCCTSNRVLLTGSGEHNWKRLQCAGWKKEWIFALAGEFAAGSRIHKKTRGTHCCYLGVEGSVCYSVEDIGRHNAIDKAIGYAAINELDFQKCILFTTGRVPVDMVQKVIAAGLPVLVSKAVPTVQAVDMAREYNLSLICSAWPDEFEVYNRGE